jgi:aminopeptidase
MTEARLQKYAELLVCAGGNVQPGQPVVVSSDISDAAFARMVANAAYDAGAPEVLINWSDDISTRTKYLRAATEVFDTFPTWIVERLKAFDDRGAVYLSILSSDPDLLNGVDPDRIQRSMKVSRQATRTHADLTMSNALRWSVLAVPSPKWAAKVFPNKSEADAIEALWGCILKAARADGENPIQDWEAHRKNFDARKKQLNDKQYKALRFTTKIGTDLTIELPKNHIWSGGGDTGKDGIPFFPNLPTEEIFTAPDRNQVEGVVVAAMPLSYQGSLIEDFSITFKNGRAVDFQAKANADILKAIIEMDEGSHYLGEVALVADNSPISQMNTLFYNTLYDENASSHLALGKAYPNCVQGGDNMSAAELEKAGINDSLLHVDFMFGTSDMRVVGIAQDGTETVLMENGDFV